MADTVEMRIYQALLIRCQAFSLPAGVTMVLPGVAYSPTAQSKFVSVEVHFNRSIETDLSLDMDPIRQGFMRTNVMWPKGLAIVGDTLWVADIDVARAFNKRTGAPIATIDLRPMKATFLNDVVAGPDGAVYITDSGIFFDAKGGMTHPGHDQIFKISGRKVTVAIKGDSTLKSPNGIAWDGANARFVLAPFAGNVVTAWKEGDSTVTPVGTGPGGYDGIEALADGRVLVTSWTDSSVHVISNGTFRKAIGDVEGPADIGVDTKRNVVAVPRFNAGRIEYFTISR
jgi:hypothetical protein